MRWTVRSARVSGSTTATALLRTRIWEKVLAGPKVALSCTARSYVVCICHSKYCLRAHRYTPIPKSKMSLRFRRQDVGVNIQFPQEPELEEEEK